jgi:hypothetical protein
MEKEEENPRWRGATEFHQRVWNTRILFTKQRNLGQIREDRLYNYINFIS